MSGVVTTPHSKHGGSRRPIPLTLQYHGTPNGRENCALCAGCACTDASCSGSCLVLSLLLSVFGVTDSPWTIRADQQREKGNWEGLLCAAAISTKFGINQQTVLPYFVSEALKHTNNIDDAMNTLTDIFGDVPADCIVKLGGPAQLAQMWNVVPDYHPWTGVFKCDRHWKAFVIVPMPNLQGNNQQLALLVVDPMCDRDQTTLVAFSDIKKQMDSYSDGLVFLFTHTIYRHTLSYSSLKFE